MPYYIIYSKRKAERTTVKSLKRIAAEYEIPVEFRLQEKEMVNHTKNGPLLKQYNILSGYIFARSDGIIRIDLLIHLTKANDFYYFLSYPDKSCIMRGTDEEYCSMVFDFPKVIRQKNVLIRKGQVVIVKHGAFKTLKGKILKIDPKRERVEVEIMLLGKPSKISLPVSNIEEAAEDSDGKGDKKPTWELESP